MSDGDLFQLPVADGPYPLGRNINHDAQNRNFAVVPPTLELPDADFRHRRYGAMVWQDGIGECVIGSMAHVFNTHPFRASFAARNMTCFKTSWLEPTYTAVTAMDPYPGQWPGQDTGTDANSAFKWARDQGLIAGWEWAFGGMQGLATLKTAPFVQGTEWTETMFYPDSDGRVHVTGSAMGGHETVVIGYERRSSLTRDDDRVWCLNDWGTPMSPWGYSFSATNLCGNYFYIVLPEWLELIDTRNGDLARPKL